MENIWIDTAVLAIPNYAVSKETAEELFDRVVQYAELSRSSSAIRVVLSDTAEDDLWASNLGPDLPEIKEFLQQVGLSHVFTPQDLQKAYQTVISRSDRSSAVAGIEVEQLGHFADEPALTNALSPVDLQGLTRRSLTSVAILQTFEDSWSLGGAFAGDGLRDIFVKAEVQSMSGFRASDFGIAPIGVVATARTISRLRDLRCLGQALRIWRAAKTNCQAYLAILLYAFVVRKEHDPDAKPEDILSFSVGAGFLESLAENQCTGDGPFSAVTFQRCAQLVANVGNIAVGPFGIPQEQREEDKAYAFRVHVTGGHGALRLMYWRNQNHIELANVGVKKELFISKASPRAAYMTQVPGLLD